MKLSRCPSCMKPGETQFCMECRKRLFNGKPVSPVLTFSRPEYNAYRAAHGERISISGVQSKYSLKLNGNVLELTSKGGEYILKPFMPGVFEHMEAMPANEHLSMHIARRVLGIDTADNALVFFRDETTPAYLTKRFDVAANGKRLLQEDCAQLAQMSEETHGKNYKYDISYERIAALLRAHMSAYAIEIEKFFTLLLCNYILHNGDAHLKNFSVYRDTELGTYRMTPAYDIINTRLHLPHEPAMALDLFDQGYETQSYEVNGFHAYDDFYTFGTRIGLVASRVQRFLKRCAGCEDDIRAAIVNSFLPDELKTRYEGMVHDRLRALRYSYSASNADNE